MSASLLVRSAGLDWRFELDSAELREELAASLGPRTRAGGRGPVGGIISMTETDAFSAGPPGTRRCSEGFVVRTLGCEMRVTELERTWRAEVSCRNGSAAAAARSALRILLIRSTFARGGLALHAASVRTESGVLAFVGPKGAGKSTAARAFPEERRLDDDLVLLSRDEESRDWGRLGHSESTRKCVDAADAEWLPLRAALLPEAGDGFNLAPLRGREAFAGCLQFPFHACLPGDLGAVEDMSGIMVRAEEFCEAVPVARFAWSLGEDLPALIERAL